MKATPGAFSSALTTLVGMPNAGLSSAQQTRSDRAVGEINSLCQTIGVSAGAITPSVVPVTLTSNMASAWNYLVAHAGLSAVQVAGLEGNLMYESDMQPAIVQDGCKLPGCGVGIAQWSDPGSRFSGLQTTAKSMGVTWKNLTAQLAFVVKELGSTMTTAKSALQNCTTTACATKAVEDKYEIPSDPSSSYPARLADANEAYQAYSHQVATLELSVPASAAVGSAIGMSASLSGGSASKYTWSFGDGATATGTSVGHTFATAGIYTINVTATTGSTSLNGSARVAVGSNSAAVTTQEVSGGSTRQHVFFSKAWNLDHELWNGTNQSWARWILPGTPGYSARLTAVAYKFSDGVVSNHIFYRSKSGTLAQTYWNEKAFVAAGLPGTVAAGSPLTAIVSSAGNSMAPAVFYRGPGGAVEETWLAAIGKWETATVPVKTKAGSPLRAAVDTADGHLYPELFYVTTAGQLAVATESASGWTTAPIPGSGSLAPSSGTTLATVSPTTNGAPQVFYLTSGGLLAQGYENASGWHTQVISSTASPAKGRQLFATGFLDPSGGAEMDVYSLTSSGAIQCTWHSASGWSTQSLPGTASSLVGVGDFAVRGTSQHVFFFKGSTLEQAGTSDGAPHSWGKVNALPG